jgi:dTDP-4-dehydrorhamnose reductase
VTTPIRILQFGATGQVAHEILRAADARFAVRALARDDADFLHPQQVANAVTRCDADVVVNATAYTAVDKAEIDEAAAQNVNGDAVGALARACAARDMPLIHLSTDYVFDGTKAAPYTEDDPPHPVSAYGRSKLAGEVAIRAAGGRHAIVRTSWVYSARGNNFVKTMMRLGKERPEMRVVDDQHGAPTAAASIARAILTMAGRVVQAPAEECSGTFHYTDAGETTWRRFAEAIFARAGMDVRVIPITAADYPTPARRPANSRLDCAKIERVYAVARPRWQDGLARVMDELNGEKRT